jgi:hypothetical protein
MNRNLVWLHVDEAGRPLRPYSRLREALRVLGVLFGCVFAVSALWCFVVLLSLLGG